jgi:hypothetical protein
MKEILNSQEFKNDGFVVLDFLSGFSIDKLNAIYSVIPKNKNQGFYTSLNFESKKERFWVDRQLKNVLEPKVSKFLLGYKAFLASFTIKKTGFPSELQLHLDWSITDETKHRAIGVWIPLCETNESNGALGLLKGSHKFGLTIRGSLINFIYSPTNKTNILDKMAHDYDSVELHLNKGQAVFYDLSLAHYSNSNNSPSDRIAINLIMIPSNAETFHFKLKDNCIYRIPISTKLFLSDFIGKEDSNIEASNKTETIVYENIIANSIEEQHLKITQLHKKQEVFKNDEKYNTSKKSFLYLFYFLFYYIKFNFQKTKS